MRLHSLNGTDGAIPTGPLVEGTDGNFYGTTSDNTGTVFNLSKTGKFTVLHAFTGANGDGAIPYGALAEGPDGNFYGTTQQGGSNQDGCGDGCGTVFRVSSTGEFTTIYEFCTDASCLDGQAPVAGLTLGLDGNFYGTTLYGGRGAKAQFLESLRPES